ncbi:MAG: ABC transporter ATP-binding protein [Treponema sp.]|nr:ABC transporter ATP-binding protein [Treponema sp.]
MNGEVILSVKNLEVNFRTNKGLVHAVRDISFDLYKGETLAIVGESGSGKSVTSKAILGIESPNAVIENGEILFEEKDLLKFSEKEFNSIRGKKIAMIFQDPLSSLDPIMKIGPQITEAMILNTKHLPKNERITKAEAKEKALALMKEVGISDAEKRFNQYPFEFSGGMRQRIVIAIAIACNPDILICDEPTTALDVTIQAQILELINRLKKERGMSVIFITHDLGVVANVADRVAVMYAGKIVEYGTASEIFYDAKHPYTWALLSSVPSLTSKERLESIPGTPPDMLNPSQGDAFAPRNKYAMQIDFEKMPPFFKVSETHSAATWLLHPDAPKVEAPVFKNSASLLNNKARLSSDSGTDSKSKVPLSTGDVADSVLQKGGDE